jgi:hypothetical protein
MTEARFTRPVADCALNPAERALLLSRANLAWPCFKTVLSLASSRPFANGAELQRAVREHSGIDRLLEFLDRRFFSRSRMIRASNVVNRALRMADLARSRLRKRLGELDAEGELGQQALAEIGTNDAFPRARAFLNWCVSETRLEFDQIDGILRELETQIQMVREAFQHFELELRAVQYLDENPEQFEHAETVEILKLLGAYGRSLTERIGSSYDEEVLESLYDRLDRWLVLRHAAKGKRRAVLDTVVLRLEAAALQLKHPLQSPGENVSRGD